VIKKALQSKALKPSINHAGVPGTIPLPATFIHDLSKLLQKEDTSVNLYSGFPFPNRKERKPDSFQQKAWEYLSKNPDGIFVHQEKQGGKEVVRVAMADKMAAQGCVNCHNAHPQRLEARRCPGSAGSDQQRRPSDFGRRGTDP
jgi:methyl-accepting chemotaxis protein